MTTIEKTFKRDAEAWAYADEYGVDSVVERHNVLGVTYVVTRRVRS